MNRPLTAARSATTGVGGTPSHSRALAQPGLPTRPLSRWWQALRARHVIVLALLLIFPWLATPFYTFQIAGQSLVLGLIALSLTLLAGYGGMVSLAQMTIAGIAGYMVAIFGVSAADNISLGWPWLLAVVLAIVVATVLAACIGWLSVRTEGIYTIMITLAIGVARFYLSLQNYSLFNGHAGFQQIMPPEFAGVHWREPVPFYYLALFWALAGYWWVKYLLRAPFGLALQGVRDNPRRMNALGFNVTAHRIAAHAVAGFIAAIGGVLLVWYKTLVSPSALDTGALINILIIAILGGLRHPIGPFIGAIVFVLMQTFGMDVAAQVMGEWARERFNSMVGLVFLLIVLFSPDGLLGWWTHLRSRTRASQAVWGGTTRHPPQ